MAVPGMRERNCGSLPTKRVFVMQFRLHPMGAAAPPLGHPTPNIDRLAKEGALFTNWHDQASCTAGRASLMTGRIPIRSALSIVVVPAECTVRPVCDRRDQCRGSCC
jgi:arylsulfatase A-like enzyme